ncbi:hypothetical protein AB0F18_08625 [Streptomyces sp. NPDC029216]|uniref:hypothetical protein n=1 Tax=Streptomyces sp. NPDC029216 TaxID=3154701 RepID=UPI003408F4E9
MLAFTVAAVLAVWAVGLADRVPLPVPGSVGLGRLLVGLVWLRVVALWVWWSDETYWWMPRRSREPVSLRKGRPGLLRRLAAYEYESAAWVFLRQSAVWLLLVVAVAGMAGLGRAHGSQQVQSLLRAGADHSSAMVTEVSHLREDRSDDEVRGYYATLGLTLPGGGKVRAENAYTRDEPKPDDRVRVLWAPTAPELGAVLEPGEPLGRYRERGWGITLHGVAPGAFGLLLVLACMLPVSVAAEAESLQELAWSPLAQTAHAAAVTGVLAGVLPYLSGVGDGVWLGAACVGLLALYIVMPIRALTA